MALFVLKEFRFAFAVLFVVLLVTHVLSLVTIRCTDRPSTLSKSNLVASSHFSDCNYPAWIDAASGDTSLRGAVLRLITCTSPDQATE